MRDTEDGAAARSAWHRRARQERRLRRALRQLTRQCRQCPPHQRRAAARAAGSTALACAPSGRRSGKGRGWC